MVWLTWVVAYLSAAAFYVSGVVTFTREPFVLNIYILTFLLVLLAAVYRGWQTRHSEFSVFAIVFTLNFALGHFIWTHSGGYFESIIGHMILHTILAAAVLACTTSRLGAVVALLLCLDVVWGAFGLTGIFPPRPWPIFTGWYYGDTIAYTGHLFMILFGMACGDGGPRIKAWLTQQRRLYHAFDVRLGIGGRGANRSGYSGRAAVRSRTDSD